MRRWFDLPLALGIAAILIPAVLLLADEIAASVPPHHHIKITPGLVGVTIPVQPVPNLPNILSGQWQGDFAKVIGTRTPLYPFAVRLKDQVLYSVFGMSGIPAIVVGRGRTLAEREYLTEYCNRDLAAFRPLAEAWAPKLRQMQDAFERRGVRFFYVITPSKVAQYPELIPPGFPCPSTEADRTGLVPLWRQVLDGAGVHYADTTVPLEAAHGQYPFLLYPRGGTHWNTVGAAIATRTIASALDDPMLPPPDFTWTMAARPIWPDDDLASLMNLLAADRNYAVPAVTLSAHVPAGGCRSQFVAIVGGSFMNRPAEDLAAGPCKPRVEEWQYWTVFDINWPGGGTDGKTSVDPASRDRKMMQADTVIYEENEQVVARSDHGPKFYAFLAAQPGFFSKPNP
jgi:alginate O-acetyltransferase complex protein AlgJ